MDKLNGRVEMVKISDILYDEDFNCRGRIEDKDVVDIAQSIKSEGLIQPITLSPFIEERPPYKYWVIAGFRRFRAHQLLKLEEIKSFILDEPLTLQQAKILNFSENLSRKALNLEQEANVISYLKNKERMTYQEIGDKLGQSIGWVQVRIAYLMLPEQVQQLALAKKINHNVIRDLASLYRSVEKVQGKEEAIEVVIKAANIAKDKKTAGKKITDINKDALDPTSKHKRSVTEIRKLLDFFLDSDILGLHAQVLGWASGEISDMELIGFIREFCENNDIEFRDPDISMGISNIKM